MDSKQLAAARAFVQEAGLQNVEIVEQDGYHTNFPRGSFDLVHVCFVFAPVGRDAELLSEMVALTKPGGVVASRSQTAHAGIVFRNTGLGIGSREQSSPPSSKEAGTLMRTNAPMVCCDRPNWSRCRSEPL